MVINTTMFSCSPDCWVTPPPSPWRTLVVSQPYPNDSPHSHHDTHLDMDGADTFPHLILISPSSSDDNDFISSLTRCRTDEQYRESYILRPTFPQSLFSPDLAVEAGGAIFDYFSNPIPHTRWAVQIDTDADRRGQRTEDWGQSHSSNSSGGLCQLEESQNFLSNKKHLNVV